MTTTPAPTDHDLDALKALEQAANPAPWRAHHDEGHLSAVWFTPGSCLVDVEPADAELIAAARNALPALLDELPTARRDVEGLTRTAADLIKQVSNAREELATAHREADMWMRQVQDLTKSAGDHQKRTAQELGFAYRLLRECFDAYSHLMDIGDRREEIRAFLAANAGADANPATTAEPADEPKADESWRDFTINTDWGNEQDVYVACRLDDVCEEVKHNPDERYLTLGEAVDWAKEHAASPFHAGPAAG